MRALGGGEERAQADCQRILEDFGEHLGLDWRRLRPDDRLETDLRLPDDRLHELMISDLYDCLETRIFHRWDWSTEELPPPPFDPWDCCVLEILQHVVRLLQTRPESG